MNRRSLGLILLVLLGAASVLALEVPATPVHWVTDSAGILDPTAASSLDAKLRAFEERAGAQFIIYIFPSLEGDSLEDFTIRAAESWRVGQKGLDNGLVLFVFVEDRKARIEVGYGLEDTLTDALSSRILRQDLAPAFAKGRYADGLEAAADRIIALIEKGETATPDSQPSGSPRFSPFDVFILIMIILIFVLLVLRGSRSGGRGGSLGPSGYSGGGRTWGARSGGFGGGGSGGFSGGGGGFGGGGASGSW